MKKVLVTGCGGFVGSVLCRDLLRREYEVIGIDNFHKGHCDQLIELVNNPNFEFLEADITDNDDVKIITRDVDAIIHLAAIVGAPQCAKRKGLAHLVNVVGTENLCRAVGKRPFIFCSTGSVYGKVEGVCTEDSSLNTNTIYGITKMEAEYLVSELPNSVSFRFATGYGVSPNMRVNLLVNDLVLQAITAGTFSVFQPDFRRTFIHVRDMSRCLIFGLQRLTGEIKGGLKYKVYNSGDDKLNWTKRQLAQYISTKTKCEVNYNEVKSDADQRDYEVSYQRLNDEGFRCYDLDMSKGIDELIKATKIIQINHQYL